MSILKGLKHKSIICLCLSVYIIIVGCHKKEMSDIERFILEGATNHFTWENDRNVAWMECGDPDGFPVFFAHGCPGSRLEIIYLDEKARQYGFRILVFERPGFGESDYLEGYPLLSFARDLERVADDLSIQKFGLMGWSSGGPPVLAAAFHLPERVEFVFSISGYTDFGIYDNAKDLMTEYRLYGPKISENRPRLFNRVLKAVRWADENLPNFYFKVAKDDMSPPDRMILDDQSVADLFMSDQRESMRSGTKGVLQDLKTQWEPWDFDIKKIKVPAHIFQGKQDSFVPWQFAEHLAENISGSKLHMYDNRGHLFVLHPEYQDEFFQLALKIIGNKKK